MKILFSSNVSWSIYNFRSELLNELKQKGFEIHTMAARDDYSERLVEKGFVYHESKVENNRTNPFLDLLLIYKYIKSYRKISPDLVLHNAIKPNIYGTIAAGFLGIPTINNISGLGTLFIKKSFSTYIAKWLYWFSQKFASIVFFQNSNDRDLFIEQGLVKEGKTQLIPGSGVDTNKFSPSKYPKSKSSKFRFLFVGRLLLDKGILEFIDASRAIKRKQSNVQIDVLGPLYQVNSTGISKERLDQWVNEGIINYLGTSDRVYEVFRKTDCLVLPSYREGLSKVLIEAASMAVPAITTNVPGCRDVVVDGHSGFLCEPKNAMDLQKQMDKMLELDAKDVEIMGEHARKRAIQVFDISIVINKYISAVKRILRIND